MSEEKIEGIENISWKVQVKRTGIVIEEYEEDLRIGRVELPWSKWQKVIEIVRSQGNERNQTRQEGKGA